MSRLIFSRALTRLSTPSPKIFVTSRMETTGEELLKRLPLRNGDSLNERDNDEEADPQRGAAQDGGVEFLRAADVVITEGQQRPPQPIGDAGRQFANNRADD